MMMEVIHLIKVRQMSPLVPIMATYPARQSIFKTRPSLLMLREALA